MNLVLPNAGKAWVEERKILSYLLNLDHPEGGPKAKFFLGRKFQAADWAGLMDALRHHAKNNPVVSTVTSPFGMKYVVECNLPTPDGKNPCIRTVREVKLEDGRPRLITAHPLG